MAELVTGYSENRAKKPCGRFVPPIHFLSHFGDFIRL
jgi:hypothetical protein